MSADCDLKISDDTEYNVKVLIRLYYREMCWQGQTWENHLNEVGYWTRRKTLTGFKPQKNCVKVAWYGQAFIKLYDTSRTQWHDPTLFAL